MQSGHEPGHSSFQVIDGTVSRLDASPAVPRRRWSAAAKERIVAEASAPGANVSAVARSHGLTPQQVFAWRREAVRRAQNSGGAPGMAFAEVRVTGAPAIPDGSVEPVHAVVELAIGDVTLRVGASVPASRVRDLLRAVRLA